MRVWKRHAGCTSFLEFASHEVAALHYQQLVGPVQFLAAEDVPEELFHSKTLDGPTLDATLKFEPDGRPSWWPTHYGAERLLRQLRADLPEGFPDRPTNYDEVRRVVRALHHTHILLTMACRFNRERKLAARVVGALSPAGYTH